MKVKIQELKKFLSAAGQIRPNPTATHLDSIKIECTGQEIIFTKTNNNIWCKYSYVCQPSTLECYMINEKMLSGIVATSKEHEINITAKNKETVIIDSGEDRLKTKARDLSEFPVMPSGDSQKFTISKESVERILVSGKAISKFANVTAMSFSHISEHGIFATNGSIVYYHNTPNLPDVFLGSDILDIIKVSDGMLYWTSGAYDFFHINEFIYGFIKTVLKPLPFLPIVAQTGKDFFVVNKSDILDFCTLVQFSKRQETPIAVFKIINGALNLNFVDSQYNIDIVRNIHLDVTGTIDEFKFSVEWVSVMLKAIPYEILTFVKLDGGHYAVQTSEDECYKGIIARLQ